MVAPRSLAGSLEDCGELDEIDALAARWARLVGADDTRLAARLATLLRRLVATLHAEPFWPRSARGLGAELAGLVAENHGDRSGDEFDDVVVPSLRLLRRDVPTVLGPSDSGTETEQRLAALLDELVAGVVATLQERHRTDPPAVGPARGRVSIVGARQLRGVYEQGAIGITLASLDGEILDFNPVLCRMLGLDGPLEQPRPMSDFVHPGDMVDAVDRLRRLPRGEPDVVRVRLRMLRADSRTVWVQVTASCVVDDDGQPAYVLGFIEDVSEHYGGWAQPEEPFAAQLARLPNQAVADRWLHRAFAAGGPARVGVCALDLEGFARIGDELGRQTSERLLLTVAGRLQLAAREHLVCRTGDHEFSVLVADPVGVGEVSRLADRLQAALSTPFQVTGESLVLSASVGVAETATRDGSPAELLRGADVARGWARALGGGRRVVFDPDRDTAEATRFALLSGLRGGIERGEFRLEYQPLVRLADGSVRGAEALVRWQHPEQGLVAPGQFIELAEQSGAIVALGRWVLEEACAQAVRWWREVGSGAPFVSVNVSPVQVAEPGWVDEVTGVLTDTGLPAHLLQLEITEQAVLGDEPAVLDSLTKLRDVGVRIALDDFGTGYSSLAWLRRLRVHGLKIDGSFIGGLRRAPADRTDASIVRALVELGHALDLEVTAEWVETPVQARRLVELGCDVGQGRWFGDAGPGEWVPELWRRSIGR